MNITNQNIDGGKAFDWGKTSSDYAKYRDIYPQEFYNKIIGRKLCIDGQSVLDMGTVREYCQEICTVTGQNGRVQIYRKVRSNRQKFFQKAWILTITHYPQKI